MIVEVHGLRLDVLGDDEPGVIKYELGLRTMLAGLNDTSNPAGLIEAVGFVRSIAKNEAGGLDERLTELSRRQLREVVRAILRQEPVDPKASGS